MKTLTIKPITAQELYQTLGKIKVGTTCTYSLKKCEELVPVINDIRRLKEEKNAVILVHSYVSPEIVYGVGDYIGDSYALSKNAMETKADIIVFAAVRFMGETAKILNPEKEVLIPASNPGCTLADAIDGETVRRFKQQYPDYTFVCYINTTAEVKAECDVCVTSANIYKIVASIPNNKIYFLPDKLMGENLANEMKARGLKKDIKYFNGACYVHEEFDPDLILKIKTEYPNAKIVAHPECDPRIIKQSDFVGSTSQMLNFMRETESKEFMMLTECGLSSRLQVEFPDKKLVGSCNLCRYMKSNTLQNIKRVLTTPTDQDRVFIDENIRQRALKSIQAMFLYTNQ